MKYCHYDMKPFFLFSANQIEKDMLTRNRALRIYLKLAFGNVVRCFLTSVNILHEVIILQTRSRQVKTFLRFSLLQL